jgi:hypothetical protein
MSVAAPAIFVSDERIPSLLSNFMDTIINLMPAEERGQWIEKFRKAVKPEADLMKVWREFVIWLLNDPADGVINRVGTEKERNLIQAVAQLCENGCVDADIWSDARTAAANEALSNRVYSSDARAGKAVNLYRHDGIVYSRCAGDALFVASRVASVVAVPNVDINQDVLTYAIQSVIHHAVSAHAYVVATDTFCKDLIRTVCFRQAEKLLQLLHAAA